MVARRKRKSNSRELQSLKRNYYTPSKAGSYSSSNKVKIGNAINNKKVLDSYTAWLKEQPTYKRFKQPSKIKTQSRIISPHINYLWDGDLMDMQGFSRHNKGYRYVLLCIDIFSRKIHAVALKSKGADDVTQGFNTIFEEGTPLTLRTDAGKEFTGSKVQELFKARGVKHYIAYNKGKSSYAERAILNIKRRLTKYMFYKKTYTWYDVLQDVVKSYNNTVHSVIGIEPGKVNSENSKQISEYQYNRVTKKALREGLAREYLRLYGEKFKTGDYVRLSTVKSPFTKDYETKWTEEVFQISRTSIRDGIPIYYITDLKQEEVKGSFYAKELQNANSEKNTFFDIEKVLKTRTVDGVKQHLVKFKNYSDKFNEWVPAKNVKNLK